MKKVIEEIAKSLAHIPNAQIFLILDAAPIHTHRAVLWHGIKHRVWLICVPAGLTWLLQPLDTHIFSPYKAFLQNNFRSLAMCGPVSKQQWLSLLVNGSTKFLCSRRWAPAFRDNGISSHRSDLSKPLRPYVPVHRSANTPIPAPTEQDIALCLPRKRCDIHHRLWIHGPSGRKRCLFLTWSSKKRRRVCARQALPRSSVG